MCLGIPGKITTITDVENSLAIVSIGEVKREVNIACVSDDDRAVQDLIGKWVLVHVGFAMAIIDEADAMETLRLLSEYSELDNELDDISQTRTATR